VHTWLSSTEHFRRSFLAGLVGNQCEEGNPDYRIGSTTWGRFLSQDWFRGRHHRCDRADWSEPTFCSSL